MYRVFRECRFVEDEGDILFYKNAILVSREMHSFPNSATAISKRIACLIVSLVMVFVYQFVEAFQAEFLLELGVSSRFSAMASDMAYYCVLGHLG